MQNLKLNKNREGWMKKILSAGSSFFLSAFSDLSSDIAIDLGTANTLVYVKGKGIVLNEPSVVAKFIDGQKNFYTFGHEAKKMLGRTPAGIIAKRPLKDGVIADFTAAEAMLKYFINRVKEKRSFIGPRVLICVPSGSTPVERKAIQEACDNAGAREVFLIEEPMAAAVGAGLPVTQALGSMIVDIGGGTTEVAILSLGGIVYSRSTKVAGDYMEESIVLYVKKTHNLLIGDVTAEHIKKTIGTLYKGEDAKVLNMKVRGRDYLTGIPREINLTSTEIAESLEDASLQIIQAVKDALEVTPPELASDIADTGIVLTGGGSLIGGLEIVLRQATKLPVVLAPEPLLSVVQGTGMVLERFGELKHLIFRQY
jgi:rod shape-determining protein MreB